MPVSVALRAMELFQKLLKSTVRRFAEATPPRTQISETEVSAILQDAFDIVRQTDARNHLGNLIATATGEGEATSSDAPVPTALALSFVGLCRKRKERQDDLAPAASLLHPHLTGQ